MIHLSSETQAKRSARALQKYLKTFGITLEYGNALNALAVLAGHADWNSLSAQFGVEPVQAAVPLVPSASDELPAQAALVSELYGALGDLVDAIGNLRDLALPDRFNWKAFHDAKVALAFCRPSESNPAARAAQQPPTCPPLSIRKVVNGSAPCSPASARLLRFGADCRSEQTSWSMDWVLALPGQSDVEAICAAFLRREPTANLQRIEFWYEEPDSCGFGAFEVHNNRTVVADHATPHDALRYAHAYAKAHGGTTVVVLKATGLPLTAAIA